MKTVDDLFQFHSVELDSCLDFFWGGSSVCGDTGKSPNTIWSKPVLLVRWFLGSGLLLFCRSMIIHVMLSHPVPSPSTVSSASILWNSCQYKQNILLKYISCDLCISNYMYMNTKHQVTHTLNEAIRQISSIPPPSITNQHITYCDYFIKPVDQSIKSKMF